MEAPTTTPTAPSTTETKPASDPWASALSEAKGQEVQLKPDGETAPVETDESDVKMTMADLESEVVEVKKEVEEVKEEVVEEAAEKEPTEEAPEKPTAEDNKPAKRDYTWLPEADREAAKHMSNPAYEVFKRTYMEQKAVIAEQAEKLKDVGDGKTLPDSWYDNPAAVQATPEYQEIKTEFETAKTQTEKLTKLMVDYKSNRTKYDPARNAFVPNDDGSEYDEGILQQLSDNRMQIYDKQKELASKGNSILENYGKVYSGIQKSIEQAEVKFFPWSSDAKHENQPYVKQLLTQLFPKEIRGQRLAKFSATMGVELMMTRIALANARKQLEGKAATRADVQRSGPNVKRNGGRVPGGGDADKKYTLADFKA